MKLTYYGQSCLELDIDGIKILFDPFVSHNPLAKDIDVNSLKPDFILVSHGHGDHVADLITVQKNSGAKVICIAEIAGWLGKQGIDNVHGMNIGGAFNFSFGRVKMVNAIHSSTMPDGSPGGNPAGFVVYAGDQNIYFAGDTALTYDMKLLEDEKLTWAILPIGDNYTMGIDDAIKSTSFFNCKKVVGVHYDSFPVIEIDKKEALDKFTKAGVELKLPAVGETITL
jgi:L-ascorbate metabolism protein UlaG (beta-lactamase superfamily)